MGCNPVRILHTKKDWMNMEGLVETVIQYGIAGIALWMMYSITFNHLVEIERILQDIRDILAKDL